jgi:hypothetical protein
MRRTSVGQFGPPAQAVLENIAARMAVHLGWDAARQAHEVAALAPIYRIAA